MEQPTFADLVYDAPDPPRDLLGAHGLIPWQKLEERIRPFYASGPPALDAADSLRPAYNLSDPGMEDLLYEAESVRRFAGLSLAEALPDEHPELPPPPGAPRTGKGLLDEINAHLESQGLRLREGTIVDASIIEAPSSTKNRASGTRRCQTKKGNQRAPGGQCPRRDRGARAAARR